MSFKKKKGVGGTAKELLHKSPKPFIVIRHAAFSAIKYTGSKRISC